MANITPRPQLITALVNQNLTWSKVMSELIDNSFDADAKQVEIKHSTKTRSLTVRDDGTGVKNVLSLVTLGWHDQQQTTSLGMYGVGAKDAWLWCGDKIHIDSVHAGKRTTLSVDHIAVQRSNWECDDPVVSDTELPSGTTIALSLRPGRRQPPDESIQRLAFNFTPALARGMQIIYANDTKRRALEPIRLPPLDQVIRSAFEIDGKAVEIDIGILPEGEKVKNGPFWLQYGHRIIDSTSLGAGQYSTLRIAGTITLGKGWQLTKNKDDFSENKDQLGDAIFSRIESILKVAERLAESFESRALRTELEAVLNEAIASGQKNKAKRNPKSESTGSVAPTDTGRKHLRARSVHNDLPGTVIGDGSSRRKRGFILDWCEEDENSIGKFEHSGSRVSLNIQHPFIASAKESGNRAALIAIAWGLISDFIVHHQGAQKLMELKWGNYSESVARLASSYSEGSRADAKAAG